MPSFDSKYYLVLVLAISLLIAGVLFVSLFRIKRREAEQLKTLEYLKQANLEVDRYKDALQKLEDQYQQIVDHVDSASPFENPLREAVFTGSPVLDRLISVSREQCEESGIAFDCRIDKIPEGLLNERRLISLFGNLIDNAYEAACRCLASREQSLTPDDTPKPFIRIDARRIKNQWVLIVSNSKQPSEEPLKNNFQTIKDNPSLHGIGSLVIKRIVRDADGIIDYQDQGDRFSVFITAPVRGA